MKKFTKVQQVYERFNHVVAKKARNSKDDDIQNRLISVFCPGPFYYFVWDWSRKEFDRIVDPNGISALNPNARDASDYVGIIHPDDREYFGRCEELVLTTIMDIPNTRFWDYKVSYCYRQRTSEGDYRLFLHQVITTSTDKLGRIQQTLCVQSIIDHILPVNNNRLSLFDLNGSDSYIGLEVDRHNQESTISNPKLTKREIQVLRLLSEGERTSSISKILEITEDTVNGHRKSILDKLDAKNSSEAVTIALKRSMI